MGDKEGFELEKGNENTMNYQSPSLSSDWRFSASNLSGVSLGVVPPNNQMGSSSCSTASMVDSYSPTLWDHPTNSRNMGYDTTSPLGTMEMRKAFLSPLNPMLKGGLFLSGMVPQSLSQFPADSAFIERAARFSSFNGGSFSDMVNPFCIPEPMAPYSRGDQEVYVGNGLKSVLGGQSQKNELNVSEASKENSPMKNDSVVRSHEEVKLGGPGNESDEAEFSGQDDPNPNPLEGAKEVGPRKRKRSGQDTELDKSEEASRKPDDSAKDKAETQQKADQNPTKASDSPKEDYIHVRARRGQATNSHSLAERVRREKISERMKFLQDLVPGCSKVTGKAVMLDEIINYVQSLQRQVEFLSMKLATVNPQRDASIEGLLAKDVLHSRPGPSSSLGYAPDMPMAYPLLHPSQQGLIQAGAHGTGNSNVLRRNINPQLTSQHVANMWEDELHNVVQMNFGTSTPLSSQEVNETVTPGQMKVEL